MAKTSGGVRTMSKEEFLGVRGLASPISDYMIDKLKLPHGLTARKRSALEKSARAAATDYSNRRKAAIEEYNHLVSSGKIKQPSTVERLIKSAQGHSDNESVKAARRALEKRGIDWRKGGNNG